MKNNNQFAPKIFVPFIVRFKNGNLSLSESKNLNFYKKITINFLTHYFVMLRCDNK